MDLYGIARQVTDEACGEGTYAEMNRNHPDPGVQAAIRGGSMRINVSYEVADGTKVDAFVRHLEALAEHMSGVRGVELLPPISPLMSGDK